MDAIKVLLFTIGIIIMVIGGLVYEIRDLLKEIRDKARETCVETQKIRKISYEAYCEYKNWRDGNAVQRRGLNDRDIL